ncbi:MAG: hypothetical protein FWD64_02275 [Acidobacteriaceae bacterium]|nr:hypothetical protein [Acidobacteriaceae bacterium]
MKRLVWIGVVAAVLGVAVWAAVEIESSAPSPAKLLPDGALLYLEAKDLQSLLHDWDSSNEKSTWLDGSNYAAFSRSHLFERLSQAQDEFSTAATVDADESLLGSVAGRESALALYDIGNLEFVYVTRMGQVQIEATPLWQAREKFEQRAEGSAEFYVRKDTESNRTAAFAARDGWLILGTRADLVAGVLDRLQSAQTMSLADEAWYADALKQAKEFKSPAGDLRMAINLEKVVPSPYFRSYWVQQNITEMKQYRTALCDLHREGREYREDRVLLRKPGAPPAVSGDVSGLLAIAPDDAAFASATASPSPASVLAEMRENILELRPQRSQTAWSAPSAVSQQNAGSSYDFETRIDAAPVIVAQSDPYQPLSALLASAQPTALLEVFSTRAPEDSMFASIERALVLQSASPWNAAAIQSAITAAIRPGLTASELGVEWTERAAAGGSSFALSGQVPIYFAVRNNNLFLATDEPLLGALLSKTLQTTSPAGVTYAAVFRHSPGEQRTFRRIVNHLDSVGPGQKSSQSSDEESDSSDGNTPPFFSGNVDSLSQTFSGVVSESMEEKDQGESVIQTVHYMWKQE